jgi:hypothetical protein
MSKLAIAAAIISIGICSFVMPSSQAAILSPMSSEMRAVLSAIETDTEQPILARLIPLPELIESAVAVSWCRIFEGLM